MKSGKASLTIILLILGIIFAFIIYSRMMTLIATKYISDFLRQELGETMGKAVIIKKVGWNPLGKVAIYGVKLVTTDKDRPVPVIEAERIQTDLTIWDIFFKKFRRPLGKIVFIKPRFYFGTQQQSFLSFYNPLSRKGLQRLILPRLYIQDGEIIVLEPKQKIYFTLKTISGFIDPTFPVRTRISLKGKPEAGEYNSFSFHGTLNLLTLTHDLELSWQGLRLSSLKRLVGGMVFKEGFADVDLKLERRRGYINPWAGYTGEVRINDGAAILKNIVTPIKFDGSFQLKEKDFVSQNFLAYLGNSKLKGRGRLFFFGEPEIDINFRSDALDLEDLLGASNLGTASGAKGRGKLVFRAFGKMDAPEIEGEISFPEVRAFSTTITDISSSFSGKTQELNLEKVSMHLCDGYFRASGKVSETIDLNFNLKEAQLHEVCNILAYTGFMVNPTLRKYSSQLKGKVDLSGGAKGMLTSPHISGFLTGTNIETGSQTFKNAKARFEYNNKGLKFAPLTLGEQYHLQSEFCSSKRRELQLVLKIYNADVESMVRDLYLKVPSPFTGKVSGKIELKGDVEGIKSHGHLTVKQGTISEIGFEEMDVVFRGVGQEIDIEDSSISQAKGKVLNMRGKIFLGDGEKNSMELMPSSTGFIWEGWNIEKDSDQMEFNMGRNISKNWYLSFSTPVDNIHNFPLIDQPPRPDTTEKAELQYRLDEERRIKLHWKDKEEFIGLEQRFKF